VRGVWGGGGGGGGGGDDGVTLRFQIRRKVFGLSAHRRGYDCEVAYFGRYARYLDAADSVNGTPSIRFYLHGKRTRIGRV